MFCLFSAIKSKYHFGVFLAYLLISLSDHAILADVANPHKTKVFQGLPAVTAVKCAVCSRPSTRKTKLLYLPIYIDLSFVIISRKCGVSGTFYFIAVYPCMCNLVLIWYCPKTKKGGSRPLKYTCNLLHFLCLCIWQYMTVQIHRHSQGTMPQDSF